jgi:hypothetical protein
MRLVDLYNGKKKTRISGYAVGFYGNILGISWDTPRIMARGKGWLK